MPNSVEPDARCPNCDKSLIEIEVIPLESTTIKGQSKFVCFFPDCEEGTRERQDLRLWRYL